MAKFLAGYSYSSLESLAGENSQDHQQVGIQYNLYIIVISVARAAAIPPKRDIAIEQHRKATTKGLSQRLSTHLTIAQGMEDFWAHHSCSVGAKVYLTLARDIAKG